jgi:hypothetical protein
MNLLLLLLIKLKVVLNVAISHFLVLMPCYRLCMSNKGIWQLVHIIWFITNEVESGEDLDGVGSGHGEDAALTWRRSARR